MPMSIVAANEESTDQGNYVRALFDEMAKGHQAAFISSCEVHSPSGQNMARVIFWPEVNKGVFVYIDAKGVISNWASVDWTPDGQWDMSDLGGGISTIRILSDLFYQLTRLPFSWSGPIEVKKASEAPTRHVCVLLKD